MNDTILPIGINGLFKKMISPVLSKHASVLLVLMLAYTGVAAQNYVVNTTADGTSSTGTVHLRGAINASNAAGGAHTITVPAGTYNLTLGQLILGDIPQNITINGAGPATTIINMTTTAQDRIMLINPPGTNANITTTITGIKFTNGRLVNDNFGGGAIICGGPNNVTTLTNCVFDNNTIAASVVNPDGGGALSCVGGGTLTIDQCVFSNNIYSGPANLSGGAIRFSAYSYSIGGVYTYPNNTLTVTNSTFTNNSAGAGTGNGGAIFVSSQGWSTTEAPRPTFTVNITENNFTANTALGGGGAIGTVNSFHPTNVMQIHYNRFVNNVSAAGKGSGIYMADNQGSVNATDNWWGCNEAPNTGSASGCNKAFREAVGLPGTLTTVPYLQLRTSASVGALCSGAAATITSGFTTNSANAAIAASNLSVFVGLPIAFSQTLGALSNQQTSIQANGTATATYTAGVTAGAGTVNADVDNVAAADAVARATITVNSFPGVTNPPNTNTCTGTTASFTVTGSGSGTLSYQWYKGATVIANGATGTGSSISGATTNILTITNPGAADAVANYNVRVSSTSGCTPAQSANASLTVNTPPAFSTAPDDTTACAGITATFTASATGSGTLSYQWYKGASVLANGATGNGSTISGATTNILTITNPVPADAAANYNLRVSSTSGCTPAQSANVSLIVNALPAITSHPANVATPACTGNPATFSVTASGSGTLSFQWFKGATPLSAGPTGTGSTIGISSAVTTSALTISNPSPSDNATDYNVRVSSSTGCTAANSNNATLTITAPSLPTATTSGSKTINSANTLISDASCKLIANVVPSGASPVSGNVAATVTITGSVQTLPNNAPYVQRHYDIVPANNAAAATATITLYFTQAEFTAYNANPFAYVKLPVDAADAANNKLNIRVIQYHGTGTAPGNYTGSSELINPADNNIVWNSTYSRWEITFNVVGFSGFYLTANDLALPLDLLSFTGYTDDLNASLQWKTANEKDLAYFEIERSNDGVNFIKTGQLTAGAASYHFTEIPGVKALYFYRLKMMDKNGGHRYSHTIVINLKKTVVSLQALPNPFTDKLMLNINTGQADMVTIKLMDINGKIQLQKNMSLMAGTNGITLNGLTMLASGIYVLQVHHGNRVETIKLVKTQ
ncbi:MAG: T9SS type A sorting domain-containing protein [Bacteroidota bacterium]